MYGVEVTAAPGNSPVEVLDLRKRLRLNHQAEDDQLTEFLADAVEQFELDACRPVLATTYRQSLSCWPTSSVIVLGRGGVTAVTAVKVYQADGSIETLDADQWRADLATPPARVTLAEVPDLVTTDAGIDVTPVGCVEFTAGWSSAAAVPKMVRRALMLLAAHFYQHREAYREGKLDELPVGWRHVVNKFKLGVSGDWGQ